MIKPIGITENIEEEANRWIDVNGMPNVFLVQQAIREAERHGDTFSENPFRHALVKAAQERKR